MDEITKVMTLGALRPAIKNGPKPFLSGVLGDVQPPTGYRLMQPAFSLQATSKGCSSCRPSLGMRTLEGVGATVAYDSYGGMHVTYNALDYVLMGATALAVGLTSYHGYKRNGGSWGWAFGWGLGTLLIPFGFVGFPAIAFAQGFGKRKR